MLTNYFVFRCRKKRKRQENVLRDFNQNNDLASKKMKYDTTNPVFLPPTSTSIITNQENESVPNLFQPSQHTR